MTTGSPEQLTTDTKNIMVMFDYTVNNDFVFFLVAEKEQQALGTACGELGGTWNS
jgi:hypothetical protein